MLASKVVNPDIVQAFIKENSQCLKTFCSDSQHVDICWM